MNLAQYDLGRPLAHGKAMTSPRPVPIPIPTPDICACCEWLGFGACSPGCERRGEKDRQEDKNRKKLTH